MLGNMIIFAIKVNRTDRSAKIPTCTWKMHSASVSDTLPSSQVVRLPTTILGSAKAIYNNTGWSKRISLHLFLYHIQYNRYMATYIQPLVESIDLEVLDVLRKNEAVIEMTGTIELPVCSTRQTYLNFQNVS